MVDKVHLSPELFVNVGITLDWACRKCAGWRKNPEPLEQSRHRGKHSSQGRRPATERELDEARALGEQSTNRFFTVASTVRTIFAAKSRNSA